MERGMVQEEFIFGSCYVGMVLKLVLFPTRTGSAVGGSWHQAMSF